MIFVGCSLWMCLVKSSLVSYFHIFKVFAQNRWGVPQNRFQIQWKCFLISFRHFVNFTSSKALAIVGETESALAPTVELNNGYKVPIVGVGTSFVCLLRFRNQILHFDDSLWNPFCYSVRWWCWTASKGCNRYRVSSHRYCLSIWKRKASWQSNSN